MKCNKGCCRLRTWKNEAKVWKTRSPRDTCAGVIMVYNTSVLVVQAYGQKWGFPKGGVKPFEKEHEAASRELYEETGIRIDAHTIKTYGHKMKVNNGVLYSLNVDRKIPPNVKVVRAMVNNDSSGVGWVEMKCLLKSTNLNCNSYLTNFIKYLNRNGIDKWIVEYTSNMLLHV